MFTLMALFAVALQTSSEGHDDSQLMKCAAVCARLPSYLRRLFQTLPETQRRRQRKARQDRAVLCQLRRMLQGLRHALRRNSPLAPHMLECCAVLRRLRQVVRKHARRQAHGRVRQNLPRLRQDLPRRRQVAQPLTLAANLSFTI